MNYITLSHVPGCFIKRVKVSRHLFMQLCPSVVELAAARDTFWRLLDLSVSAGRTPNTSWWRLAAKAEALLFELEDYSI